MAKWDTFENVLGTRDTLREDIEEFGTLTLSDACLHKRLINDVPSLAEMLEKEAEIKKRTKGGGKSVRGFMRLRLLSKKIETSDCTRGRCPCSVYWCKH